LLVKKCEDIDQNNNDQINNNQINNNQINGVMNNMNNQFINTNGQFNQGFVVSN